MYATLLTVLLAAGAQPQCLDPSQQPVMVAAECETAACGPGVVVGCSAGATVLSCIKSWFGPMPQTCYAPRYGCYPGNDRYMNRYPAFHGYYQHEAYNYRQLFDYPWHAAPYEPQGYYACEVYGPSIGEVVPTPDPESGSQPIAPMPLSLDPR